MQPARADEGLLQAVAARWRVEAEVLRRYADERGAAVCELHATELEAELRAALTEELTLQQASRESGYSERRLRELIAEEKVPNAGRKHAPRIRRVDLPHRVRRRAGAGAGYDAAADAQALAPRLGSGRKRNGGTQ